MEDSRNPLAMSRRAFSASLAGLAAGAAVWRAEAAASEGLDAALDAHVAAGDVPGLVALVAHGDRAHVHVAGVRDLEAGAPMRRDTIFAVASIGKPVTAAAALALVEDGVLGLDDPVDSWLPELAERRVIRSLDADLDDTVPAARPITLRDLLTMRMGLGAVFADPAGSPLLQHMAELELAPGPRLFGHSADEYMRRIATLPLIHQPGERWLYHTGMDVAGVLIARASGQTLEEFTRERILEPLGMKDTGFAVPPADADRLATLPLIHQPGERWLYHTGMDVAGVLIARASGQTLEDFTRERILEPLGMKDTGFAVPPADADRLATCYRRDPASGELEIWNPASGDGFADPPLFEAGGGGHVSTVDDFLAFGRMMLNGGAYRGRRILSEASVRAMVTDQIAPEQKAASPFFPGFWDTHGWGLGIGVVTAPDDISPIPGRFGWWGGFGTTFWVDPHTDTVALLFTQRMMSGADDTALSDGFLRRAFALKA